MLQLKDELWRACRVVIDVGIQTRGMAIEEIDGIQRDREQIRAAQGADHSQAHVQGRLPGGGLDGAEARAAGQRGLRAPLVGIGRIELDGVRRVPGDVSCPAERRERVAGLQQRAGRERLGDEQRRAIVGGAPVGGVAELLVYVIEASDQMSSDGRGMAVPQAIV